MVFADDTLLFSVVQNTNDSATQLNNDLDKVINWAYIDTWKMSLKSGPSKKYKKLFFQGPVQMTIILLYTLIIYKSPRLLFKNIFGCVFMKITITKLS